MQPGLQRMVLRLEELVQRIDGEIDEMASALVHDALVGRWVSPCFAPVMIIRDPACIRSNLVLATRYFWCVCAGNCGVVGPR